MRIQNNLSAGQTNRFLAMNNDAVNKSSERLSSGYRINSAGDDAAGLAISEKMRAQIRGLDMAVRNSQDATSLIQTAEGALQESTEILKRMRDLAVQSSNGVYDDGVDRAALNKEMDALKKELDRISTATEFNGKKLLDGSMGGSQVGMTQTGKQLGTAEDETITVSGIPAGMSVKFVTNANVGTAGAGGGNSSWTGTQLTVNLDKASTYTQEDIDKIIASATGTKPVGTDGIRVTIGDGQMTIGGTGTAGTNAASGLFTAGEVKAASGQVGTTGLFVTSTKGGTDVRTFTFGTSVAGSETVAIAASTGDVTVTLDKNKQYTKDSLNELLAKHGAEMTVDFEGTILGGATGTALADTGTTTLAGGSGTAGGNGLKFQIGANGFADQQVSLKVGDMSSTALGVAAASVATQDSANNAIAILDKAINSVSSTRADLGALQNRMSHTIKNLNVSKENLTAAESRIRDVDMAAEMTTHTKNGILSQAATAMLAQANQQPQGVLQLLR